MSSKFDRLQSIIFSFFILKVIYLTANSSILQVQWDEPSSILRPERVSPWELEPLVANAPPTSQPTQRNKRARPPVLPSPTPDMSVIGRDRFPYGNSSCKWFLLMLIKSSLHFCIRFVEIPG